MLIPVFIHIYIPTIHYTAPILIHIMYSLLSLTLRLTSFDIFFSFRGGGGGGNDFFYFNYCSNKQIGTKSICVNDENKTHLSAGCVVTFVLFEAKYYLLKQLLYKVCTFCVCIFCVELFPSVTEQKYVHPK